MSYLGEVSAGRRGANHIRNIGLVGVVVMFAQPSIIAGVGGDAVKAELITNVISLHHRKALLPYSLFSSKSYYL